MSSAPSLFHAVKPHALALLNALREFEVSSDVVRNAALLSSADDNISGALRLLADVLEEGAPSSAGPVHPQLTPGLVDFIVVPVLLAFNQTASHWLPRSQEAALRTLEVLTKRCVSGCFDSGSETGLLQQAAAKRADEVAVRCLSVLQASALVGAGASTVDGKAVLRTAPSEEAAVFACTTLARVVRAQWYSAGSRLATTAPHCLSAGFIGSAFAEVVSLCEAVVGGRLETPKGAQQTPYHRPLLRAALRCAVGLLPVLAKTVLPSRSTTAVGLPQTALLPRIFPGIFTCALVVITKTLTITQGPIRAFLHTTSQEQEVGRVLVTPLGRGGVLPLALELAGDLVAALFSPVDGSCSSSEVDTQADHVASRLAPVLRPLVLALQHVEGDDSSDHGGGDNDDEMSGNALPSAAVPPSATSSPQRLRESVTRLCRKVSESLDAHTGGGAAEALRVEASVGLCLLLRQTHLPGNASPIPLRDAIAGLKACGTIVLSSDRQSVASPADPLTDAWLKVLSGYCGLLHPQSSTDFLPTFIETVLAILLPLCSTTGVSAASVSALAGKDGNTAVALSGETVRAATRKILFLLETTSVNGLCRSPFDMAACVQPLWRALVHLVLHAAREHKLEGDSDSESNATTRSSLALDPLHALLEWTLADGPAGQCRCAIASPNGASIPCFACSLSSAVLDHARAVASQALSAVGCLVGDGSQAVNSAPETGAPTLLTPIWQRVSSLCQLKASLLSSMLERLREEADTGQRWADAAYAAAITAAREWLTAGSTGVGRAPELNAAGRWDSTLCAIDGAASLVASRTSSASVDAPASQERFVSVLCRIQRYSSLASGSLEISCCSNHLVELVSDLVGPGAGVCGGPVKLQQLLGESNSRSFVTLSEEIKSAAGAAVAAACLGGPLWATVTARCREAKNKPLSIRFRASHGQAGDDLAPRTRLSLFDLSALSDRSDGLALALVDRFDDGAEGCCLALELLRVFFQATGAPATTAPGPQARESLRGLYRKTRPIALPWLLSLAQRQAHWHSKTLPRQSRGGRAACASAGILDDEPQSALIHGTGPTSSATTPTVTLGSLRQRVLEAYLQGFPRAQASASMTDIIPRRTVGALSPAHCLALAQAASEVSSRSGLPTISHLGTALDASLAPLTSGPPDAFLVQSLGYAAGQCTQSLWGAVQSLASSSGGVAALASTFRDASFSALALANSSLTTLTDASASIQKLLMASQAGHIMVVPAGMQAPSDTQGSASTSPGSIHRRFASLADWGLVGPRSKKSNRQYESLARAALEQGDDMETLYDRDASTLLLQGQAASLQDGAGAGKGFTGRMGMMEDDEDNDEEAKLRREEADDDPDGAGYAATREERLMLAYAALNDASGSGGPAAGTGQVFAGGRGAVSADTEGPDQGQGASLLALQSYVDTSLSRTAELALSIAFSAGLAVAPSQIASSQAATSGLIVALPAPSSASPSFAGNPEGQAADRLVYIEALRVMESGQQQGKSANEPQSGAGAHSPALHPRQARARLVTARTVAEAVSVTQSTGNSSPVFSGAGVGDSATRAPSAPAMFLPVLPLPLVGSLITLGKAACSELLGLGPYSLSVAAALDRGPGTGAPALPSSVPFMLPAARSALYRVVCCATGLLAYPSTQYPFIAQSVWPALAALLPQPGVLRAAAQRFVAEVAASVKPPSEPSSAGSELFSRNTSSGDAAQGHDAGFASAIETQALAYMSARREQRRPSSTNRSQDAMVSAVKDAANPFALSFLALGWLQALHADVLMVVAALVGFPDGGAAASPADTINSSSLSTVRAAFSSQALKQGMMLGGCCGDFLRGRLREVVFPSILAVLQAEVAMATGLAAASLSHEGKRVSLPSSRSLRRRLLLACLKVVIALGRPCATVPRDDDDSEKPLASVDWKNPDDSDHPVKNSAGGKDSALSTEGKEWKPLPAVMPLSFTSTSGGTQDADAAARQRRLELSPAAREAAGRDVERSSSNAPRSNSCVFWSDPVLTRAEARQLLANVRLIALLGKAASSASSHLGLGSLLSEAEETLEGRLAGAED